LLRIKCEIECERCRKVEKVYLVPSLIIETYGPNFAITNWKLPGSEGWRVMMKHGIGQDWYQALYCPYCFRIEQSLIPKKKTLKERIFG
jgi:hypothetical protein